MGKETRSGMATGRTLIFERWRNLSLRLDLIAEDKVGGQSQDDKENTQDNEIYVKLCIFYIQQLQNLFRLLELTHLPWTLQL